MNMKMNIFLLHEKFCNERLFIRNFTPATIKWYKGTLKAFLKYYSAIESVDDITTTHLHQFLYNGRIKQQWTSETFLNYYKGLKVFFDWCVKNNHLQSNPIISIEKPKIEKKLPKRISKQDALKLLEFSFNKKYRYKFEAYRNQAIIATFIYTGMRAKELLELKLQNIDMQNNIITIQLGKGNKDRIIPICSILKMYFSAYLKDRERLLRTSAYFFTSTNGDFQFTYSGLKLLVAHLKKATGVKFSCHKLRHTFATLMLEGGCDLFSLQKMMGHSDIQTTTLYLSATAKLLQEQMLKHPLS